MIFGQPGELRVATPEEPLLAVPALVLESLWALYSACQRTLSSKA